MQKALLSLFAIFSLHSVNAQYEEKDFVQYTVREGLSENYITCLAQDEWGYMWIGTDVGLNRFDGHSFKKFFQGTKTLPLLSGSLRNLKIFGTHQLGILNRGGFQLLNTSTLSLKNYTIPDTTAFSLYLNAAWDAAALPGNAYAVSTASGFYVFDASGKLTFRHDAYQLKDIGQKRILYGRDILPLNDKEYLILVNADGLAHYNSAEKKFTEISTAEKNPLISNWADFYPLAPGKDRGFISYCQLNKNEFIFYHHSLKNIVYYNRLLNKKTVTTLTLPEFEFTWESKIARLNDSSFLINGGHSGFYMFTLNKISGQVMMNPVKFLAGHKIQCLYLDKDKRLWAGTSKGLLKQKLTTPVIKSYTYQLQLSDTLTGGFNCAYRYKEKLYIGRFSLSKGLLIADAATGKQVAQIDFYGKNNQWNEIRSIQMYHPDTLWIGTNAGPLWFDTKTYKYGKLFSEKNYNGNPPRLNMMAPANKDGYAWMCSYLNGLVARYDIANRTFTFFSAKTRPALPFNRIKSIAYDAYGNVWIGGHSLTRWNTQKQLFDTLISVYGGPNKYDDDILTLVADTRGSLWLHNAFNGLLEYRIKEKKFVSYGMKDGLPSDVFYGFSQVINHHLWIAGHNHFTNFNTVTKKLVVYDYGDGLPEDKPTGRNLYFDSVKRTLYLFNNHTLSKIYLSDEKILPYSNDLVIEELIINNKEHHFYPVSGLRLKPNQNNLSLHFGIINYESGNEYQFAYKLKEKDNWIDLGEQRSINLTALSPGHYTISLRATGKSGQEKTAIYSVVLAPPFWKTNWFLISCGLLSISFIYLLYRNRIGKIRQKANIDKQLSQAEMKALHAQMNPHFIFNSLNSIREMILNNENKEASHYLSKFAHLIRMTLDQSGQSFISLRTTIEYLNRYVEMEQIRNSHFTCRIVPDDRVDQDETVLPPMLIQPFVENAIWHGTTSTQKNITINISFKKNTEAGKESSQLICIVEDNGIGINESLKNKKNSPDKHHSVGIENVNNRINLMNEKYNLQSSVIIEDKSELSGYSGTGTVVTLRIPLEINEE